MLEDGPLPEEEPRQSHLPPGKTVKAAELGVSLLEQLASPLGLTRVCAFLLDTPGDPGPCTE